MTDIPPAQESPEPDDSVYEVRLGWNFASTRLLVGAVVMGAFGMLIPDTGPKVIWVGLCTLAALLFLTRILRRPLVLRVDRVGVTLGSTAAFGPQRITASAPWTELAAVVLFERRTGAFNKARLIGLLRLDDDLGATPTGFNQRFNAAIFSGVPAAVANRSLLISGWRLDRRRLGDAIHDHAPQVDLLDLKS